MTMSNPTSIVKNKTPNPRSVDALALHKGSAVAGRPSYNLAAESFGGSCLNHILVALAKERDAPASSRTPTISRPGQPARSQENVPIGKPSALGAFYLGNEDDAFFQKPLATRKP